MRPQLRYAEKRKRPRRRPWRRELSEALTRGTEHVSLYQLTIEPDTIFERLRDTGKLNLPDADTSRALWDTTQEVMNMAGMPAYEISNHAKPGAESRHNLIYWRYGEYIGVGPGAHGFRCSTRNGRHAKRPSSNGSRRKTSTRTACRSDHSRC